MREFKLYLFALTHNVHYKKRERVLKSLSYKLSYSAQGLKSAIKAKLQFATQSTIKRLKA